jgi:hypothetical protein
MLDPTPYIAGTPPVVAFYAGFMTALALKRGRIAAILDRFLPGETS